MSTSRKLRESGPKAAPSALLQCLCALLALPASLLATLTFLVAGLPFLLVNELLPADLRDDPASRMRRGTV
ncbi:MAG: hypothetical protein LBR22_10205 [Desulfovibrio sp.]|jgi:hypothetical protein|nr:hypothetical protein [Desulfovibrio sp.]